ncbi:DNA-binding FadR family transcriptional regulator [Kitasatospora sp. SolWspMP-SS2h]|uniref:FadR/GntR family transcriptional regulator n=1 Tax=Kitasatospora sp. SolWspMP-SS2h TaxID=1305729 RepID=UPI000DBAB856|nr:FadR/GntR family transcriptional regulator [Kitasatospora sp. SolWspMP-SS2h]RAJ38695.1 DNA-binding FadR family transcriptional regulator [Kitasatospora sp. SolWspMP-SS2h]
MEGLQAAGRRSLVDAAIEQLREQLASGVWPVGARIPTEHELAERLQVGRNTVREAIRVLVHAGMLVSRQGEGTFVRSTSDPASVLRGVQRSGVRDVLEVRAALETEAARLAAERHTAEDLARMRAALEREAAVMAAHPERAGREATVEHDLEFHTAVVEAAHNPALTEVYRYFGASVRESMRTAFGDHGMPEVAIATHAALVDAIESRDPERAEAACRALLAEPTAAVEQLLAEIAARK